MAMTPKLRNSVIAAVGGGAIAIASALITGPTGNDGLEGVRYDLSGCGRRLDCLLWPDWQRHHARQEVHRG
jgi:hypothetical protein